MEFTFSSDKTYLEGSQRHLVGHCRKQDTEANDMILWPDSVELFLHLESRNSIAFFRILVTGECYPCAFGMDIQKYVSVECTLMGCLPHVLESTGACRNPH